MRTAFLWATASATTLAWCGPADAQANSPEQADSTANSTADSAQADSTARSVPDNAEVVVTARRRTENLMKTAISGTVLTGTDLANKGVSNVDALQFAAPSITVNNFGQGNDFNVRGIGKAEHNSQTTTGVIVYRDGVPTFPGYVQGEPYYDIANIQVLRGPQGTVVGQNATGGAVFVNTNDPVIGGGVHGYVQGQFGNYSDVGAQGAINLPISSTLAARISLYSERRGGFYNVTGPGGADYTSNNGDLRMASGRFSLLWKPSDNFSMLSKTDLGYMDYGAFAASPYWQSMKTLPSGATNPYYSDLFDITANAPMKARDKFVRSILRMEYATDGGIKFRSISSYQKANIVYGTDLDGTSSDFPNPITGLTRNYYFYDNIDERQLTQEFNIISPDNQRFTWLVGAFGLWNKYYFKEPYDNFTIHLCYPFDVALCKYQLQGTNPTRSVAAFGQVGFNISDSLKLEVGGRYTASRSTNHVDVEQYGFYIRDDQTTKSHNFSYKVSLGWEVNPSQYLYGFVATGFRPGGLNVPVGLGLPEPFKPEKVTSFEAGWKANWLAGHVRTTIDGFYNSYKGFQVTIGYPTFPTFGFELNVPGTTKIYGFEAEVEANFGRLRLDGGISAVHSELGTFYAVDTRHPPAGTPSDPVLGCDPATGPASAHCIDLTGQQQTYAPNFTFNAGAQYEFAIGAHDTLTPRINFGHVAGQWATLFEDRSYGDRLEARNILNAQLAWQHGDWTVTAYGTNLTDQHYPAALNSNLYFAGAPRQYGIRVHKKF